MLSYFFYEDVRGLIVFEASDQDLPVHVAVVTSFSKLVWNFFLVLKMTHWCFLLVYKVLKKFNLILYFLEGLAYLSV